ncbi:hypothetical protein AADS61_004701 [Escherichia coli]|uniref:hypothetical protein n=1 Tax=Citrobacter TaxID=544 RepID=UPI0010C96DE0|nr:MULTISPECIES: hypothetical protein [Citrobacter]ELK6842995.1 hypothetical protein [Citrobacter braakii]MBJ9573322.1 hypothetical protein [Citrobacter braakii]TKU01246.1 hypothetical protein FDW91_08480 [Citrobacter sp. wls831]
MKIKNKKHVYSIFVALISVILLVIINYSLRKNIYDSVNCSALVTYYLHDDTIYSGSIKFSMRNNKGSLAYSGSITDTANDKTNQNLLRIIYFNIVKENDFDYYKIYNFDIKKNINDSISDIDFSKKVFDLSSGPRKIKIQKEQNGLYSIGNVFSPVFMCVVE